MACRQPCPDHTVCPDWPVVSNITTLGGIRIIQSKHLPENWARMEDGQKVILISPDGKLYEIKKVDLYTINRDIVKSVLDEAYDDTFKISNWYGLRF